MGFKLPWGTLTDPLPKDDVRKLAKALERRFEAIEMNGDALAATVSDPTFRRLYIATEESRTSASYGTLTTPDQVANVPMPRGGFIVVAYQATWKESATQAARAAIFLGSNQLKIATAGVGAPETSAAAFGGSGNSQYAPLVSSPFGLVGGNDDVGASAYTGDVTTGQALGMALTSDAISLQGAVERGGTRMVIGDTSRVTVWGGGCLIFAGAGNYTVSVQYKTSSGTVTAKERKLAVWTVGAASGSPA